MKRIFEAVRPEAGSPEARQWQAENQERLGRFAEFCFRCVEMTLVVGAVRFIEIRIGAAQAVSTFLTVMIAIYVRSSVAVALYPVGDRYSVSERARRYLWWMSWLAGGVALIGSNLLLQRLLPIVVANIE